MHKIILAGLLMIVSVPIVAFNLPSPTKEETNALNNKLNSISKEEKKQNSADQKLATPDSSNKELNTYTDTINKYSVSYPKHLQIEHQNPKEVSFSENNVQGPWLINLSIKESNFESIQAWVESQNSKRGKLDKIVVLKTEKHNGENMLYLKTPVVVDQNDKGEAVYDNQESAVILKNHVLFSIKKREQSTDKKTSSDFEQIVNNFHLL